MKLGEDLVKIKWRLLELGIVLFFILLAIFGPVIAPKEGINEQMLTDRLTSSFQRILVWNG